MDITLYHNPRCSKSRATLALLEARGVEPRVVLYLEQPPTADELGATIKKLGITPWALLRRNEDAFKGLDLTVESSDDDIINAMVTHPVLIERPIVVAGERAVIGRPPENVDQLF